MKLANADVRSLSSFLAYRPASSASASALNGGHSLPRRIEWPRWTREDMRVSHTMDFAASPFSISRFVEDVRGVVPVAGRVSHERLPDGRTILVLRVFEEGRRGDVCVAGPRTRALFKNATGVTRAVMLQFKPGWSAQLLGVAASALTDQIVHLEDIWGRSGGDLCLELLAARSLPEMLDRLSQALALRAHQTSDPASARLARRAVRLFEGDEVRVESVAERLGVTARHLRRAFTESVGIGPKDFARAVRLRRAVGMATTSKDWGRIAADAGYYDQAHLITDFRELVGLTPGAFVKRAGGVPEHHQAAPCEEDSPPGPSAPGATADRRSDSGGMLLERADAS